MAKSKKPGQPAGTTQQPSESTTSPTLVDRARARGDARPKAGPKRERQERQGSGRPGRGAAAKRKAQRRTQQRTLLYSALALGVIGGLVAFIVVSDRSDSPQAATEAHEARQASLASNRQAAGCGEIQRHASAGQAHIQPDQQPSNWNSNPPTSGDHLATPLPGGFYPEEQDERALVHSLEHGYVAIQHKNLPPDQVAQLQALQGSFDGQKLIVMPYSGLENDGVAMSAWQHSQTCRTVDRAVIEAFIDSYMVPRGRLSLAPEPTAA